MVGPTLKVGFADLQVHALGKYSDAAGNMDWCGPQNQAYGGKKKFRGPSSCLPVQDVTSDLVNCSPVQDVLTQGLFNKKNYNQRRWLTSVVTHDLFGLMTRFLLSRADNRVSPSPQEQILLMVNLCCQYIGRAYGKALFSVNIHGNLRQQLTIFRENFDWSLRLTFDRCRSYRDLLQ